MENVYAVANYIKSKGDFSEEKVQKLLYYAYSIYLYVRNNEYSENMDKLFDGKFLAWPNGPREANMYINHIKRTKLKENTEENINLEEEGKELKDKLNEKFIDGIILMYGKYSEKELEEMTTSEKPWLAAKIEAYETASSVVPSAAKPVGVIKDKTIFEYCCLKYEKEW